MYVDNCQEYMVPLRLYKDFISINDYVNNNTSIPINI